MTAINGTDGGNVLGGGIGSDTIRGRRGDDTLTGGGGQDRFVIRQGDGTDIITDFGGVGTGVRPTAAVIAEVDVLQFEGDGLTAENLLLTQQESDLLISFEGVEDTQVILQGFALENLDNLQRSTGAAVDLGNILFNGQSQIEDSFDVFNADQDRSDLFNPNTVTFLNDLDNFTLGRNGSSSDVISAQSGDDVISGLSGNDLLRGEDGDDALSGDVGNDLLRGGAGNDDLSGVAGNDSLRGGAGDDTLDGGGSAVAEVDALTGGAGSDRFTLATLSRVFYNDGDSATAGTADYALITDFNTSEDVIQLNGQRSDYRLSPSPSGLPSGTAILLDKPAEEPDELIGIVQGTSKLRLDSDDFSFNPPEFNLSELDGRNGFVLQGIDEFDGSGDSVSIAGDVNGDGFDDLLIGAPFASPSGQVFAGQSYVVFGSGEGFDPQLDLAQLDGSNGFVINGIDEGDRSGFSVSTAGDVNGDGFDDLLIGAPDANGSNGQSYVVFGSGESFAASLDLSDLDGSNGFVINGIDRRDFSGVSVSTTGDVNGDGFDDLIVGAFFADSNSGTDPNGQESAGQSYVVFGSGKGFAASLDLSDLDGSNGFVLNGIDEVDFSGASVSTAGDVNGDGFNDLLIGAVGADPNGQKSAGESYVVFGSGKGFAASLDLSDLDGSNGFVLNGINEGDASGVSVSTAGDVNGDDLDDLLIGASSADPNGQESAGESYVVFGSDEGFAPKLDLAQLDGSSGFVINGIDESDLSGFSVSTAGDVNGDGFDDLLIGAPDAGPSGLIRAGESYVVFGRNFTGQAALNVGLDDSSSTFLADPLPLA